MTHDDLIVSRYESKYVVPEALARRVRDFIQPMCSLDKHAGADGRYMVNNLHFDTPDLRFCYDTRQKRFTRFKPHMRYYGERRLSVR